MKNLCLRFLLFLILISGCKSYDAKTFSFPSPVDTTTKPIQLQEKKTYSIPQKGVYADNQFDGARLNDFTHIRDNEFRASISPENKPINSSAYYAFKIWSDNPQTIRLELHYTHAKHRYIPKISLDGKKWNVLPSSFLQMDEDSIHAFLLLDINDKPLWIAAQEIQNSTHVREWCTEKAKSPDATFSTIGKSKLGRDLFLLDIHDNQVEKEDVIVILSRQHPPEVTGYLAMQAFIDEIMADNKLANQFRKKYRILVYPLMNPDGVDLGHWRHNAGGIDLNRDWAYYHQPENKAIANSIVRISKENKSNVILGLDFHSTWYDVYYTNKALPKHIPHFKDYWLQGIKESLKEDPNEKPSQIGKPVSKNWFHTQFGAVGITYEIGDNTPRDFIKQKGKVSATEMMELLIFKGE